MTKDAKIAVVSICLLIALYFVYLGLDLKYITALTFWLAVGGISGYLAGCLIRYSFNRRGTIREDRLAEFAAFAPLLLPAVVAVVLIVMTFMTYVYPGNRAWVPALLPILLWIFAYCMTGGLSVRVEEEPSPWWRRSICQMRNEILPAIYVFCLVSVVGVLTLTLLHMTHRISRSLAPDHFLLSLVGLSFLAECIGQDRRGIARRRRLGLGGLISLVLILAIPLGLHYGEIKSLSAGMLSTCLGLFAGAFCAIPVFFRKKEHWGMEWLALGLAGFVAVFVWLRWMNLTMPVEALRFFAFLPIPTIFQILVWPKGVEPIPDSADAKTKTAPAQQA